jgi:hypothetical protein
MPLSSLPSCATGMTTRRTAQPDKILWMKNLGKFALKIPALAYIFAAAGRLLYVPIVFTNPSGITMAYSEWIWRVSTPYISLSLLLMQEAALLCLCASVYGVIFLLMPGLRPHRETSSML